MTNSIQVSNLEFQVGVPHTLCNSPKFFVQVKLQVQVNELWEGGFWHKNYSYNEQEENYKNHR